MVCILFAFRVVVALAALRGKVVASTILAPHICLALIEAMLGYERGISQTRAMPPDNKSVIGA